MIEWLSIVMVMSIVVGIALILTCLLCSGLSSVETTLPFDVPPHVHDVVSSTLFLSSQQGTTTKYSCEFSFETGEPRKKAKVVKQASRENYPKNQAYNSHVQPDAILGRLAGVCTSKTLDYWKYEVCFENKITQSHGGHINDLGHYARVNDQYQEVFTRGAACEALPQAGFPPRTSVVQFACGEGLKLLTVEEVQTCQYKFVVSTPLVCGFDTNIFPLVSSLNIESENDRKKNRFASEEERDRREQWFLELYEFDYPRGQVACNIRAVVGEKLEFKAFSLRLIVESSDSTELVPVRHVAKTTGRVDLDLSKGMYRLDSEAQGTQLKLSSGQGFQGDLAFVLIQALPTI